MQRIPFFRDGRVGRAHDAAYVASGEEPRSALVEAVIGSVSTNIEVRVGSVTMHLAAWMDPDHWAEEWGAAGVADVDELLAGAVQEEA